jgi:hypothetical protein
LLIVSTIVSTFVSPLVKAKPNWKLAVNVCKKNGKKDTYLLYDFAIAILRDGAETAKLLEDSSAVERASVEALPYIEECLEIAPEDEGCRTLFHQAKHRDPTLKGVDGKKMTHEEREALLEHEKKHAKKWNQDVEADKKNEL